MAGQGALQRGCAAEKFGSGAGKAALLLGREVRVVGVGDEGVGGLSCDEELRDDAGLAGVGRLVCVDFLEQAGDAGVALGLCGAGWWARQGGESGSQEVGAEVVGRHNAVDYFGVMPLEGWDMRDVLLVKCVELYRCIY
jgi:hypothetical protein